LPGLLLAQRVDLQLLLVGDFEEGDPLPSEVRTQIEANPGIRHVGWLADPAAAYRAMDLLVFPSYREGLPNVPLEAQLCGVPVVGYAATGTVDAVMDREALVPVGDVDALAKAIRSALDGQHPSAEDLRTWVTDNFDRSRVWAELASRYRRWLEELE
jgi:glycosyltransferase involved in cell wall biosynthesis